MQIILKKYFLLFGIGAVTYGLIEVVTRGYTHWTMALTGGAVFCTLYFVNTHIQVKSLILRSLIGGLIITAFEYNVGMIVNYGYGMGVWDYSDHAFNLFGQICLRFTLLWMLLCVPVTFMIFFLRKKFNKILV